MQRKTNLLKNKAPLFTISVLSAVIANMTTGMVFAQGPVEEIQVTGSRISRSGMTTPTPVTVMEVSELSNMSPGQLVDSLDQLPQFLNNSRPNTAASKADSAGASNLNMRGVGSKRTLVLLDGRRVVPSNRLGTVDINLFPEALIQRVETVTGGASAAYGTDAVAGVVNFILNKNFTGIKTHVQGGTTSRNDNDSYEFSIAGGTEISERMHLTAAFDTFKSDRIDNLDGRDWHRNFTGLVTNPAFTANGTGPRLLTRSDVRSVAFTKGGFINAPGTSINRLVFGPEGSTSPFVFGENATLTGTQNMVGGSGYNPASYDISVSTPAFPEGTRTGSFVPESERRSAFVHLDYDLSDNTTLYAEGGWGNNKANSVGTLPLGNGQWGLTAFRGNAFLPENISNAMNANNIQSFTLQRYHTEADIAQDRMILDNNTYSATLGLDTTIQNGIFSDWQVRGYWQLGRNDNNLVFSDFLHRERLPMAMDAVRHPTTNQIVCRVTLFSNAYNDCVPVNLFGVGRASQAAIDWVSADMWVLAELEQESAEISADGIIHEGFGAGEISLAVGANWREQSINHRIGPDHLVNQPKLVDNPAIGLRGITLASRNTNDRLEFVDLENFSGRFDVKELFAETLVPLIAGTPGVQQMNLSLAARWAEYSGSGDIWAWKYGLDWQVNDQVRLRGNISRDVRAASLEERFDRQGQGTSVQDPELKRQTYTTFQIRGGNPNVAPEEADTMTLGLIYQPSWLKGFSTSVDWYNVEVKDAIDFLGVQEIVDQCSKTRSAEFCGRIARDPETKLITLVQNTFANVDLREVSGVDIELAYTTQVQWFGANNANMSWRFLGSWLKENSTTDAGAPKRDLVGEVGVGGLPEFRWTSNITYAQGPFTVFLQGRWTGSGINDIDYVEGFDIDDNSVESILYTDLRLSYLHTTQNNGEWELFFHTSNLFDEDPPLVAGWSNFSGTGISTNESLYDVFGRRYTAGVQYSF